MMMVKMLMKMWRWSWRLHDIDNDDADGDANGRASVLFRVTQVLMAQKVNQVLGYVQHNHDCPASFFKLITGDLKGFCWRTLLTFQEVFCKSWLFRWTKCSFLLTFVLSLLVKWLVSSFLKIVYFVTCVTNVSNFLVFVFKRSKTRPKSGLNAPCANLKWPFFFIPRIP